MINKNESLMYKECTGDGNSEGLSFLDVIKLIHNGETSVNDVRPESYWKQIDSEPAGDSTSAKRPGKLYYSKGTVVYCLHKEIKGMFYGIKLIKLHPEDSSKSYSDFKDESIIEYLKGDKPIKYESSDFIEYKGRLSVFHNGVNIIKPFLNQT